jgi:hypothetical protein
MEFINHFSVQKFSARTQKQRLMKSNFHFRSKFIATAVAILCHMTFKMAELKLTRQKNCIPNVHARLKAAYSSATP